MTTVTSSVSARPEIKPVGGGQHGSVMIELYAQVDETEISGDAIVITARRAKTWASRIDTPSCAMLKSAAGDHFHAQLKKELKDLEEIGALYIFADPRSPRLPFRDVIFVERTTPVSNAIVRALRTADEYNCVTVVLPMVCFLDPSLIGNDKALADVNNEFQLALEGMEFQSVKTIKLVHPSGPGEYGSTRRRQELLSAQSFVAEQSVSITSVGGGSVGGEVDNAVDSEASVTIAGDGNSNVPAGASAEHQLASTPEHEIRQTKITVKGKSCPQPLNAAHFCGNINSPMLKCDAVIATVPSVEAHTKYAITSSIARHAGVSFHKQLPGRLKDGEFYHVPASAEQNFAFKSVIFCVRDGNQSVKDCVIAMLEFADKVGCKVVQVPLLSFVESKNKTVKACGDVINDVMAGIREFVSSGWNSLELVYMVVPDQDEVPDDPSEGQK